MWLVVFVLPSVYGTSALLIHDLSCGAGLLYLWYVRMRRIKKEKIKVGKTNLNT